MSTTSLITLHEQVGRLQIEIEGWRKDLASMRKQHDEAEFEKRQRLTELEGLRRSNPVLPTNAPTETDSFNDLLRVEREDNARLKAELDRARQYNNKFANMVGHPCTHDGERSGQMLIEALYTWLHGLATTRNQLIQEENHAVDTSPQGNSLPDASKAGNATRSGHNPLPAVKFEPQSSANEVASLLSAAVPEHGLQADQNTISGPSPGFNLVAVPAAHNPLGTEEAVAAASPQYRQASITPFQIQVEAVQTTRDSSTQDGSQKSILAQAGTPKPSLLSAASPRGETRPLLPPSENALANLTSKRPNDNSEQQRYVFMPPQEEDRARSSEPDPRPE